MVHFIPFKALRPAAAYADRVCCLPYDVLTAAEAQKLHDEDELSFVRVIRSETDMPKTQDVYASPVYDRAAANLKKMEDDGVLVSDEKPCYYIYRETDGERAQTGIVGIAAVDDYKDNYIRRHELTLPEKETDRLNHFIACGAHTEPVFLMIKPDDALRWMIAKITADKKPEYDFTDAYGIGQQLWAVNDEDEIESLMLILNGHELFYIADGHHRTASAARVADALDIAGDTQAEFYDYFMAAVFPADELHILDYNRLLTDFGEMTEAEFLAALESSFEVTPCEEQHHPTEKHSFTMYTNGKWYKLFARPESYDGEDPAASIDAAILQKNVFSAIFDIKDPATSARLKFIGGIRGYAPLKEAVDSGSSKAAFMLFPVGYTDIMGVADKKMIMPPKSTWFEPKLRSGLFIHKFK